MLLRCRRDDSEQSKRFLSRSPGVKQEPPKVGKSAPFATFGDVQTD